MPIALTSVEDAFFAVLHTDAAGTAVRAQLATYAPDAAGRIIRAEDLNAESLPRAPFLALGILDVPGRWGDVRTHLFEWYGYDDMPWRWGRINTVLQLVERAYARDSITFGELDMIGPISRPFTDHAIERRGRRMRFAFTTRR